MRANSNPLEAETDSCRNHIRIVHSRSRAAARVAVVTIMLARSAPEAEWLERSLRVLSRAGLPVYVGEGGSNEKFVTRIARLPNLQVCRLEPDCQPTLVNQLRRAFAQAQAERPDYVLYTEPDKRAFFNTGLKLLLSSVQKDGPAPGLILASRTPLGLASFPLGQRVAEGIMNQVCGEALGCEGDYTYGPMLIAQSLFRYLHLVPEDLGWGWRFFLVAVAHQLGLPVSLCPVPNRCPASQRHEDDDRARDGRLRQLEQNVTGLANGWTCLLDEQPDCLVTAA